MKIQWLGQSTVKITTATHTLLVDPYLTGNPVAPCTWQEAAKGVTDILITHGHSDHIADVVNIANATDATVVAMVELANWLADEQGVEHVEMANLGGTVDLGQGHSVTLVPAWHSTGIGEGGRYGGTAAGLVIATPEHTLYHAGDTCIFGDMALIEALYKPTIGFLPVGGRFTMDGRAAAYAAHNFFNFNHIIPIHFATFPLLAPNADDFVAEGQGLPINVLKPGETLEV